MMHRSSRRDVRCTIFVASLLCIVSLLCEAGITFVVVFGDQVELKATRQAGVPSYQELRATNDF
jgi:hypothetical protein